MVKKKPTKAKKKGAVSALKRPGTFTAKAKKKGITTAQLQANVEKDPDKYDEKTKEQAKLRGTLAKLKERKQQKEEGKSDAS